MARRRLEVDWERYERSLRSAGPPTPDDVSRALDGTPLDTPAAVVRHMADLEARGLITHTGTMFTDALAVLERDGEDAMVAWTHETYGTK